MTQKYIEAPTLLALPGLSTRNNYLDEKMQNINKQWYVGFFQAVAWYTPLYWNRRQGWVANEQSENIENMVISTFSTIKQKEGWEKEQQFTVTDTEWKRADPRQTGKKRQSFIKRYLMFIECTL